MEVYYTRCLIEGHPHLVAFVYGSDNNVVSQRFVEKLQLPTTFHPNQACIKFSIEQYVKEVLCDVAPMDSCHLLLEWAWLRFKTLNLDERSLYLRHEGHKVKLRFMTPRQVSKDQHRLKEKIEKEKIKKESIKTAEGRENEKNKMEVEKNMMESLFVNVFSSTVCDVILHEQKDMHVNETHQIPCLKTKLIHSVLLCIWSADEKQIRQTQRMELFIVTYQGEVVLAGKVLHGLQPLEKIKDEYIQIEFDPGGRELVSSCGKIKSFTRSQ